MSEIIIREAKAEEFDVALPALATRAYQDRFFNEEGITRSGEMVLRQEQLSFLKPRTLEEEKTTKEEFLEYSGSLSIPFSVLRPQENGAGQSLLSFTRYWQSKKEDFLSGKFKAFVAEIDGKVVGFMKGTFDYVDFATDFPAIPEFANRQNIAVATSIYVDPNFRRIQGIGTKLVQKWFYELLKEKPDCQGKISDCYWRNNSQYFFNKLGAKSIGFCNIPDMYLDESLTRQTQNIVGEVMFWDREAMEKLVSASKLESGQTLASDRYTRNTSQYSLMTVARGSMVDFISLREQNLGVRL